MDKDKYAPKPCRDHLGNQYSTRAEMARAYALDTMRFIVVCKRFTLQKVGYCVWMKRLLKKNVGSQEH